MQKVSLHNMTVVGSGKLKVLEYLKEIRKLRVVKEYEERFSLT